MKKTGCMRIAQFLEGRYPYWRTICIYRYFSLFLISVFYSVNSSSDTSSYELLVVGCLLVAALTLNYLYIRYEAKPIIVKLLTIIETVSNIIILIPTGGLESPYIWYSLNTVLITSCFLSSGYFIFNLVAYTGFLTVTSFYLLNEPKANLISFFYSNSNLILSYILIITAIQLLVRLINRLEDRGRELSSVNKELAEANSMIEGSMGYVASLFQSLQDFVSVKDKSIFPSIIAEHIKNITRAPAAFIYILQDQDQGTLEILEDEPTGIRELLSSRLSEMMDAILCSDEPEKFVINDREIAIAAVRSASEAYGVMGIEIKDSYSSLIERENISQVKFLAALISIIFERFRIEEVNRLLLISEEQNRIANEIHDSVSQRLFYVSCKVHTLIKAEGRLSPSEASRELKLVKDCLGSAMTELRETIYNYGRRDKDSSSFEEGIRSYINEISELNNVAISLNIIGNQELINLEQKRIIYRIICEGIGNSIKHGRCRHIEVDLCLKKEQIILNMKDDGSGFDMGEKTAINKNGMGLRNLNNLVSYCNGIISIQSQPSEGTRIDIMMPNMLLMKVGQEDTLCV